MTLLEKIDSLMAANSLNKRRFSIQSGIPYSTIDGLYKVGYENMRIPTFRTICSFFGVTMDSMAYDDREIEYIKDAQMKYSSEDAELVRGYHAAVPEIQSAMMGMAREARLRSGESVETSEASGDI